MNSVRHLRGFTLVETTLGLGVAAVCLTAIMGLLVIGSNSNQLSIEQSQATNILNAVAADLRAAPNPRPYGSAQTSTIYSIVLPATVTSGSPTPIQASPAYIGEDGLLVPTPSGARYQLNVWITPALPSRPLMARILLTWPAAATVENANGSVESIVAINRN